MSKSMSRSKRVEVLQKSRGHCWYCGGVLTMNSLNVDHVVPKDWGGGNELSNLVPSCKSCNSKKKNRSMDEFRAIMSRIDGWLSFSTAQKSLIAELVGVNIDDYLMGEPYTFWFEKEDKTP